MITRRGTETLGCRLFSRQYSVSFAPRRFGGMHMPRWRRWSCSRRRSPSRLQRRSPASCYGEDQATGAAPLVLRSRGLARAATSCRAGLLPQRTYSRLVARPRLKRDDPTAHATASALNLPEYDQQRRDERPRAGPRCSCSTWGRTASAPGCSRVAWRSATVSEGRLLRRRFLCRESQTLP